MPVTLRFENVRKDPGFDEWTEISRILTHHSLQPVKPQFAAGRRVGSTELRDVSTTIVVEKFAALDDIEQALADLASSARKEDRSWIDSINPFSADSAPAKSMMIDFSLSSAILRYASSFVTSDVTVVVTGYTNRDHLVTLYLSDTTPPVSVTADRTGQWKARVPVLPATSSIYGTSTDPKGQTRMKYFRINTTTLKHENINQTEFEKNKPVYTAPGVDPEDGKAAPATSPRTRKDR